MAEAGVILGFHFVTFIAFLFSTLYDFYYIEIKNLKSQFDKFCFLTFWNAILQTIYYGLCVVSDVFSDRRKKGRLQRWRDLMHSAIAFPVGMFVVITFWTLYAIDRELVFPTFLDKIVPPWLNHMLHTAVFPFLVIDKYLVHHQYPRRLTGLFGACGLALVYLAWILFIAYYEDFWVYPILQVLRNHERVIFISLCLVFFGSFYILGESLTKFIWRSEGQPKNVSKQTKSKRK